MPKEDTAAVRDSVVVDARLAWTSAIAAGLLDDADRQLVRSRIAKRVEAANALRRVPLDNGDEPEFVFVPFRQLVEPAGDDAR